MGLAKAQSLLEIADVVALGPLEPGNAFYTDLSVARSTDELNMLRTYLENCGRTNRRVCAAFIGHRGSGKTTELKQLEGKLAHLFTCLHLEVPSQLEKDTDYTDIFLWMVQSLVQDFADKQLPLDATKADAVARWFAERSIEDVEERKKEIEFATQADATSQAGANFGLFAFSLKLLARIQARITGSHQQRTIIRQRLQYWSPQLVATVNDLLAHAQDVLRAAGRPGRLLIIQDNLDRLPPDSALRLFRDNGDTLTKLAVDCVWTAPINARLAPFDIGGVFPHRFTMPTIKVHDRNNEPVNKGIDGLVAMLANRIEMEVVFAAPEVAAYLAAQSGGSVRDLLRLLGQAQLAAQVDGFGAIEQESAEKAVRKLRNDLQGALVPGNAYYPLLATVFFTKRDASLGENVSPEQAASNQHFYAELLVNGSVLEYNGTECWCDVHPVIHGIRAFQDACERFKA